ncbi:kappa-type opioid receptor-like [Saccoglossus kowalevskii]|uniref:Kappa-type opioid receptor-like n=1 Tax=Saccoglossus kowalevskii TaxID=10224 RepID=A0ABM0MC02_SACKO|nr:PREDICTED: kappa-type opioid receptor-like [Saccoglossus kowalevskii]
MAATNDTLPDRGSQTPLSLIDKNLDICRGVIAVIGMLANGFVIYVFLRVRFLRSITNLFLINQSAIDCLCSAFLVAMKFIPISWPLQFGAFNDFICKIWVSEYLMYGLIVASTMNLVCVTIERYIGIVYPLFHRGYFTDRKAKIMIVFVWAWGYACELVWMIVNGAEDGICMMHFPSTTYLHFNGFWFITVIFILPVTIMLYAYIHMFISLRHKNINIANVEASGRTVKMEKARRNVIKTLATVFIMYIICWLPEQAMYFQYCVGIPVDLTGIKFNVALLLINCNMIVNPFIYTIQYNQFKQGVRTAFRQRTTSAIAPLPANPADVEQGGISLPKRTATSTESASNI